MEVYGLFGICCHDRLRWRIPGWLEVFSLCDLDCLRHDVRICSGGILFQLAAGFDFSGSIADLFSGDHLVCVPEQDEEHSCGDSKTGSSEGWKEDLTGTYRSFVEAHEILT